MTATQKTVAVLFPGEMGTALAALLVGRGARVVTTLNGRGPKTIERSQAAGITVVPTFEALVRASDFVISLVTPLAAQQVADSYLGLAYLAPANALYIDANSIGPESVQTMARGFATAGVGFIDGAINGLAKNLATSATFFLSGPRAGEVSDLIGASMRVSVLGKAIGQASAMKMLLSGVSKGVSALFVEVALAAQSRGMLPELIDACSRIYPGVMGIVDRMLPTYADHGRRRVEEMSEVVRTVRSAAVEPCLMSAVLQLHERLAEVNFSGNGTSERTAQSLIASMAYPPLSGRLQGGAT
jgi:3-hydroxyisobutyrate dehydrogenase-like beta-hydroxyacid dehydrogenase